MITNVFTGGNNRPRVAMQSLRVITASWIMVNRRAFVALATLALGISVAAAEAVPKQWEFFCAPQASMNSASYAPLPIHYDLNGNATAGDGVPNVSWDTKKSGEFVVRSDADRNATQNRGSAVLMWTCPKTGNWSLNFDISNAGTDVTGGDGGDAQILLRHAGAEPTAVIGINIPVSRPGDPPHVSMSRLLLLEAGDKLDLRVNAGIDGFGDRFIIKYAITETAQTPWEFFCASFATPRFADYLPLPMQYGMDGNATTGNGMPNISWNTQKPDEFIVRCDADKNSAQKRGSAVLMWTCPKTGNWSVNCGISNIGLDVTGGDGGHARMAILRGGEEIASVSEADIPISRQGEPPHIDLNRVVRMEKGDKLETCVSAGIDGFGDRFVLDYTIAEEAQTSWSFYAASLANPYISTFTPLTAHAEAGSTMVAGEGAPHVSWNTKTPDDITVSPDADKNSALKKGSAVLFWTCPKTANWSVNCDISNIGTDVKGGDGGYARMSLIRPGDTLDSAFVTGVAIPVSQPGDALHVKMSRVIHMNVGDILATRISAGIDGYGDRFLMRYTFTETEQTGTAVGPGGTAGLIANPPREKKAALPLAKDYFWLGCGGDMNATYASDLVKFLRPYVPNLLFVPVTTNPEQMTMVDTLVQQGVPVIAQDWGTGLLPYLTIEDGLEYTWDGTSLNQRTKDMDFAPESHGVWLSGHAAAQPHPATRTAYGNIEKSAIRSGCTGFSFCDMVWWWPSGRGASGYNPKSIAAYRQDLLGTDAGLKVTMNGRSSVIKFQDYARYYIGGMPSPQSLGLISWADYSPITAQQYVQSDYVKSLPQFLLFDLLVHYEWLKFADYLGQTAQAEGGIFSSMPNPEDMANGSDYLFLNALDNVSVSWEEVFNSPANLDGVYFHMPYLRKPSLGMKNKQSGVVLEVGGGGNVWPYYANELAYVSAYELTLSTQADCVEGDFWHGGRSTVADMVKGNPYEIARYKQMLAYGLGFKDAQADRAVRIPADFVSVTSRNLFRPWGKDFMAWSQGLGDINPLSPEYVLASSGYSFSGIGQEGMEQLPAGEKLVLYAPNWPTIQSLRTLLAKLTRGDIKNGILIAEGVQQGIDTNFNMVAPSTVMPELACQKTDAFPAGQLTANGKVLGNTTFTVDGDAYAYSGGEVVMELAGKPLVVKTSIGKGVLFMLLFNPGLEKNRALAAQVFSFLLGRMNIMPHWTSTDGTMARIFTAKDLTVVSVQSKEARDPATFVEQVLHQADPIKAYLRYRTNGESAVRVKFVPKQQLTWVCLPSGNTGHCTTDAQGFASIAFKGTAHEMYFFLPDTEANRGRIAQIRARKALFDRAMTLSGLVPAE